MTVDDKLSKIGFRKVYEDTRRVHYERYDEVTMCYQTAVIERRIVGNEFRLQYHDEDFSNRKNIVYTDAALSIFELKLFLKKMKQKEREYAKNRKQF